MSKVEVKNLGKSFNNIKVLENINLKIEQGEFISLLGFSGCGKTTLLNLIAGLEQVDSGEVFFDDIDITSLPSNKRNATIVYQDFLLFPHMNVFENIAFGLKVRKISKLEIKNMVEEMLEVIGLMDKKECYPSELSGGQKQRVAIARALIVKPNILLLDEPFSGLDTSLKYLMRDFVIDLTKKFNITTIMVTHDMKEAFSTSSRVAILNNYEIQIFDTPQNIYNNPKNIEVAKFLSVYNIIDKKYGHYFNFNDKEIVINYNHIKIVKGNDYKVINKIFLGEVTQYTISNNDINLIVNENNHTFSINDSVGIVVEKVIEV